MTGKQKIKEMKKKEIIKLIKKSCCPRLLGLKNNSEYCSTRNGCKKCWEKALLSECEE